MAHRLALAVSAAVLAAGASFAHPTGDHDHEHDHSHDQGEHRHAEAHVHGAATLEVVSEGGVLDLKVRGAMYGFVGFERDPQSDAERAAIETAAANLSDAGALFAISERAGCEPVSALHTLSDDDDHAHDHAHDHGGHRDVEATYRFACADLGKLRAIGLPLFKAFPGLETVDVTVLGESAFGEVQVFTTATPERRRVALNPS